MVQLGFKPMLFPNNKIEEGQEELYETGGLDLFNLPSQGYLVSLKRDGVRAEIGNGNLKTRALKPFANKQLNEYFQELLDITEVANIILEGELYSESTPFDELSGILRSFDKPLPIDLKFYCFDWLPNNSSKTDIGFSQRYSKYRDLQAEHYIPVEHYFLGLESIKRYYTEAVRNGFEGVILRNPISPYKLGRLTHKDNIGYKMKGMQTYDCIVTGFEPEYENLSESYTNELGYKKKHQYKADKQTLDRVGAIIVTYNTQEVKVNPAMTIEEKEILWRLRKEYIGAIAEVKGMESSKGKIRHPVLVRFRFDKEDENEI